MQQASSWTSPDAEMKDPGNRLKWKFDRRRLDAESLHDRLLQAGGNLSLRMEGPSEKIDDPQFSRRSVYAYISRDAPSQFLQVNDFPDPTIHAEQRSLTTSPLQQLFLMNSPFARHQSSLLADRVAGTSNEDNIREVYRIVFGRTPTDDEVQLGLRYLDSAQLSPPPLEESKTPKFAGTRMKAIVPNLGQTYSVEFWFRNSVPYQERPVTGYLFSRGKDASPTAEGDHLGIGGHSVPGEAGKLLFYNGNSSQQLLHGKTMLEEGRWHHVAVVRHGSEVRVYLDGRSEPEISGTISPTYSQGADEFFLGGRSDNFANFSGRLGGVSLYNRMVNPDEVKQRYQLAMSSSSQPDHQQVTQAALQSSPVSYWELFANPTVPGRADDLSSQHHGTYEGNIPEAVMSMKLTSWRLYCHALLCSNELLYVD